MSLELDQETVRAFVAFRHPSLPQRRDVPPRVDPNLVGKLANRLASRVLGGLCDGDQCRVAECAGLLVYAMDGYGLTYEEVCQVACRRVAEILRQITADPRQTDPKRYLELRSCIGQADALTLVVKLAELMIVVDRLPKEYTQAQLAARSLDIKNWIDRATHVLDAMRALKEMPKMQSTLAEAKTGLNQLTKLVDQAKAAEQVKHAQHRAADRQESPAEPDRTPQTKASRRSRSVDGRTTHR